MDAEAHPDFYAFYNRVLRPEIARVEPLRRQTLLRAWAIAAATLFGMAVCAVLAARVVGWDNRLTWYSTFVPIGIGLAVWAPVWSTYRDEYQLKLVALIVRLYNESFSYRRDDKVGEGSFTDSGLFSRYLKYDRRRYRGSDRVSGRIGVTAFEFSDLDVSVASGKSSIPIFKGVFFVADFNKNFSGETFVTSRHALLHLGTVAETPPGEVVTLEDPEFERAFVTHGSSQIEARYILSPALMRRILHFGQQDGKPIAIAFSGTSMFIAMYHASTNLEPRLTEELKPALFFGIWRSLEFLCGIVNEMDLNTRIWTKASEVAAS